MESNKQDKAQNNSKAPFYNIQRPSALGKLTSSPAVDLQLHSILSLLLRDYIGSWYADISSDEELFTELYKTLTLLIERIESKLTRVDWFIILIRDY